RQRRCETHGRHCWRAPRYRGRSADSGNRDGADRRSLLVHEAQRTLVVPDLTIRVARWHDDDAALPIDEWRELRPLGKSETRGVVEEMIDDGVPLLVTEERQARDQFRSSRHLILPTELT